MKILLLITANILFLLPASTSAQNFWQQTNGPFGGAQVNDFLYYGDSTVFLATSEGIIKSLDNGNTWERIAQVPYYSRWLSMDSSGAIYAIVKPDIYAPSIIKSTDIGNTWSTFNHNNIAGDFRNMMFFYKDTVIVGTWDNGLYRTFNGGQNWTQINNGLDYLHIYLTKLLSNGDLLVGTSGSGVYRSTDWGDSWTASNNGIPLGGNGYRYVMSIIEINPGKILCGTQNGVYYSTNFGNNWVYRSIGIGSKFVNDMTIDYNNNIFAGADLSGVYLSTNDGNNWIHLGLNYSIYTLGWDSGYNLCAGGLSYGLNRYSFEDSTWTLIYNRGYTPVETDILSITENENLFAGTWWWGLYRSNNGGQIWEKTGFTGIVENMLSIDDSTTVLGQPSGVYISIDSGNTWNLIADYYASSMFYDSTSKILYVGTNISGNGICGIYATDDLGQNWSFICNFENYGQTTWVNKLLITNMHHYILASIVYGDIFFGNTYAFYRSTDNGQTWENKYDGYLYDVMENYSGDLYAKALEKLLISHNEGFSWILKNIGGICLASDYSGRIFIGGGAAVKAYDKNGNFLSVVGNTLPYINDIILSKNNHMYVATDHGVYFGDLNNIVLSIKDESKGILSYFLYQNFPNPFNPTTKIKYQIPEFSNVKLTVYDVLGKEIKRLVNEEKPAGDYEVEFDGTGLPSGVYFYRIETGKYSDTKKFVLLK